MRKYLLPAAICLATLSASPATAYTSGFYITPKYIYTQQRIKKAHTWVNDIRGVDGEAGRGQNEGGALAFGYDAIVLRYELEVALRGRYKEGQATLETNSVFVNFYHDFRNHTVFTPYLSAGAGFSSTRFKIYNSAFTEADRSNSFAWNVGIGAICNIFRNEIDLDIGYRFVDYGKAKFSRDIPGGNHLRVEGRQTGTEIIVGLKYHL